MTYIIKASGEKERFSHHKLARSIIKAGASRSFAHEVAQEIKKKIKENISSQEILRMAIRRLKDKPGVARRYDLKRAIMQLGPSGFPFEKFFADILEEYGYETEVGKFVPGQKVNHEIDIIAMKDKKRHMVECKYHNYAGNYTNLKVSLYTYARFLDVKKHFNLPWLVTNTKCSADAINYAKGVGMKITTWNYPSDESLQDLIMKKKLYPITLVRGVHHHVRNKLFSARVFMAKDILEWNVEKLHRKTGLRYHILHKLIREAGHIVNHLPPK